ncbi:hypothetical protein ACFZCG_33375 [Streptomyces tanashiensis]
MTRTGGSGAGRFGGGGVATEGGEPSSGRRAVSSMQATAITPTTTAP